MVMTMPGKDRQPGEALTGLHIKGIYESVCVIYMWGIEMRKETIDRKRVPRA
jgi:hypothetical protein